MLTLNDAQLIIRVALDEAAGRRLKPLAVVVLDSRGSIKASVAQDGTSLLRDKVAHGKAFGALALGLMTQGCSPAFTTSSHSRTWTLSSGPTNKAQSRVWPNLSSQVAVQ